MGSAATLAAPGLRRIPYCHYHRASFTGPFKGVSMASATIWSNARALKPTRASAVLPDFEFSSFKLEIDGKVLDALDTDSSGARVAAYMVEDAQGVYEEYRNAGQSLLGDLDSSCTRKGVDKEEVAK
jgi:hypothetical protein